MNPDTNKFEPLSESHLNLNLKTTPERSFLVRPDGTEVPKHWTQFQVGEAVVIKDYTFKVAYVGETSILFEPLGPAVVGEQPTLASIEARVEALKRR